MRRLFGTNGVRGITNEKLTPELALQLGKAIGTFFGPGSKVLVGRDARSGGEMLLRALESGLLGTGAIVYEAGKLPTPALQYATKGGEYACCVIVTASHNPPEFNGIKVIDSDGIELDESKEMQIEEIYFSGKFSLEKWHGLVHDIKKKNNIIPEYIASISRLVEKSAISRRRPLVLIDGCGSVGSLATPKIASMIGCEVREINTKLDPRFRSRDPEPTSENLKNTAEKVLEIGADFGVAHDGDADRAIFIDSYGRVQMGDRSGALLAAWAAGKNARSPRVVYTPFSSSAVVEEHLRPLGIKVEFTKIGSIYVSRSLLKNGGIAGVEDTGGFIYPIHQYVRDGPMSLALMADLFSHNNATSAEMFDRLPRYYTEKTKIPLQNINFAPLLERMKEKYGGAGRIEMIEERGFKFTGKSFWFIVRESGTEPVLRIGVESKDADITKAKMEELKRFIGQ